MRTGDDTADPRLETHPFPLTPGLQEELVALLRTEWTATDYDWAEAMSGRYSDELTIISVFVRQGRELVATATVHYSRQSPSVAVLGNVLTRASHRGSGLAGKLIEAALALATEAGCSLCLLGSATKPRNVYLQHGFAWQSGVVMRRDLRVPSVDASYFAPRQTVSVRAAHWGDLPGFTLLVTQPLAAACLDYPRRLLCARIAPLQRCLSNFPAVWYDTAARGGGFKLLCGSMTGSVLGFGTVTFGTDKNRAATLDFVAHDHYVEQVGQLVDSLVGDATAAGARELNAFISVDDPAKLACLRKRGFAEVEKLAAVIQLPAATFDVVRVSRRLP